MRQIRESRDRKLSMASDPSHILRCTAIAAFLALAGSVTACVADSDHDGGVAEQLEAIAPQWEGMPVVRYVGTLEPPEGSPAPVSDIDIEVSNTGDALGTITIEQGDVFEYLSIDGNEFLWTEHGDWRNLGIDIDANTADQGLPVLMPAELYELNIADLLAPATIATDISDAAERLDDISVGDQIDVDSHQTTPVDIGDKVVYLAEEDPDPWTGGVIRLDTNVGTTGLIVVLLLPVSNERVKEFYFDFREKLETVDSSVDPKVAITTQEIRNPSVCTPTHCTVTLRVTVTYLGESSQAGGAVDIEYNFNVTRDGVVAEARGCDGTVRVGMNQSVDIDCSGVAPNPPPGNRNFLFEWSPHLKVTMYDEEEYKALLQQEADNRQKVYALADTRPPGG